MNNERGSFEDLQRLLASRRHVQAPAGFRETFAERVKERIEHPEPPGPLTWRERLGLDADWKPAIVCAWGVALCGSLVVGIIVSLNLFQQQTSLQNQLGAMPGGNEITKAWDQFLTSGVNSQAPVGVATGSSVAPIFTLSEPGVR